MVLKDFGIETWVLTTPKKKVLTTEFLEKVGEPYRVYVNKDWDLPKDVKPHPRVRKDLKVKKLRTYYGLNAFRCFRGHQVILSRVKDQYALVFEDDAWPTHKDWRKFIAAAVALLGRYQVVSFHGRSIVPSKKFTHKGRQYVHPTMDKKRGFVRCWGSLCYLVRRRTGLLIADRQWQQLPMDLLLCNEYRCCVMEPSPFNHNRKYGSLVDGTKPKAKKKVKR